MSTDLVPFTYFNIHDLEDQKRGEDKYSNNKRLFYVNDKVISIRQFKEKGIGGIFWDTVKYFIYFNKVNFSS